MKSVRKPPEAKVDSVPQEDDYVTLFLDTVRHLFGNRLMQFTINQNFNPITMFGMNGVVDAMGPMGCTINMRFGGKFEEMVEVRQFLQSFAHNVAIHEQMDSNGTMMVYADFIVSGAALKNNRKLYDAHFDRLIEDELSKKPE